MPIELYTGKPGNGKTALMVERLVVEAAKAERPIFAAGVAGLEPGLAAVLDDPKRWAECPDGSLIFVDEAWKWFGHLHDASRQATPPHVLQLAEHRHRGIDFIWTSQGPNQLYPFARPLIADHYHVVRRFNTSVIDVFKWEELQDDVKSSAKRDLAQRKTRTLPSAVFGKYKSAEIHTIKARIPFKLIMLPFLLLIAAGLAYFAYRWLKPENVAARTGGTAAAALVSPGQGGVTGTPAATEKKWSTPTDYAKEHLPRFDVLPWSAPVYDGRSVTADPQIYCMSSMPGEDGQGVHTDLSCTCLTDQGTRYELDDWSCRTIARQGPAYNPYREKRDSVAPAYGPVQSVVAPPAAAGAVVDASATAERQDQHHIGGGIGGSL